MKHDNNRDYLFKSSHSINFQINPAEYGFDVMKAEKSNIDLKAYTNLSEIYSTPMAPSTVSIGIVPSSDEQVIVKQIFKEYLVNDFQKAQASQECSLQCSLKHQNIVEGYEWSEDEKEYVLLMEFMNKADYFEEKIDTNHCPVKSEEKMKSYMNDILEGLTFLHSKGVVHGDIKLENMLMDREEENDSGPIIKLSDFGLSRILSKDTGKFYMEFPVGSSSYMAPEIKSKSNLDEKIDLWALGISLYKMSVAYKPTQIAGFKYGNEAIPFRKVDWRKRSPELQDLIKQLLEVDPLKRISANDALQHPWFQI